MSIQEKIDAFLESGPFAVVGASTSRAKYGNKVLRAYQQAGREAHPVNPRASEVEGATCYPDLGSIPGEVGAVSIITPPAITEQVVEQAVERGIGHLWMQPGAESEEAVRRAEEAGIEVIHGGPCLLVVLGFREG
jgi:predicted CoA-binding protein